jgi:DNA-binding transcriptional regulator YiaG
VSWAPPKPHKLSAIVIHAAKESQLSNIATALKEEIARLIRKQLRGEMEGLKRASSRYRADIAALKRRIDTLEKQMASLGRTVQKQGVSVPEREPATKLRFKPQSMLAQRTRLGLSAREMGLLVGVSGQTIYHWETGKTRPRPEQLANIAVVRKMGKRAVKARLDQVQTDQQQPD